MDIRELGKNWNELGRRDAFGNILTDPVKQGRWQKEEFFQTGENEIAELMKYIEGLDVTAPRRRALDFGCGVGRLTQPLCRYFSECYGVDIAPSMVEQARRYNAHGERCRYFVNGEDNLRLFDDNTFDLVYSNIVLQHMRPEFAKNYIREFLRVIERGGLVIFQVPSHRVLGPEGGSTEDRVKDRLPEEAFSAAVAVVEVPERIEGGERFVIKVRVKNTSAAAWPLSGREDGTFSINVGNHWLGDMNRILVLDDGRCPLPRGLAPGDEVTVPLLVTAPAKAGDYGLEIDVVQESIAWFKDKGSPTVTVPIRVGKGVPLATRLIAGVRSALRARAPGHVEAPRMEMYGIPQNEIVELVEHSGARVVDVVEYLVAGEEWQSFRYCVSR